MNNIEKLYLRAYPKLYGWMGKLHVPGRRYLNSMKHHISLKYLRVNYAEIIERYKTNTPPATI